MISPAVATFLAFPWPTKAEFEFDYPAVREGEAVNIQCPGGCGSVLQLSRWAGLGDGPTGWCDKCKKGVTIAK